MRGGALILVALVAWPRAARATEIDDYHVDVRPLGADMDRARVAVRFSYAAAPQHLELELGGGLSRLLAVSNSGAAVEVSFEDPPGPIAQKLGVTFPAPDTEGSVELTLETPMTTGFAWFHQTATIPWMSWPGLKKKSVTVRVHPVSQPLSGGRFACSTHAGLVCERSGAGDLEVRVVPIAHQSEWAGLGAALAGLLGFFAFALSRLRALKFQLLTFRGVPEEDEEAEKVPDRHHPYRGGRPQPKIDPNEVLPAEALFIVRARVGLALIAALSPPAVVALWPVDHAALPMSWLVALTAFAGIAAGARYLSSVFISRRPLWVLLGLQAVCAGYALAWASSPQTVALTIGLCGLALLGVVFALSAAALVATGHAAVLYEWSRLDLDHDRAVELVNEGAPSRPLT